MNRVSITALKGISITSEGLTDSEVLLQRDRYGFNRLLDAGRSRWREIFQDTVRDPMMWFLVSVSILFFFVGKNADAVTLLVAILPLAFMDAFLHWRTKSATGSLNKNFATEATVIRNGSETVINALEVVPGDLVKLRAGDVICADGLFEISDSLQINESVLTGESLPVKKNSLDVSRMLGAGDEVSVDIEMLARAGTKVLSGNAHFRVLKTGRSTDYGEIAWSVSEMPHEKTPLQNSISKLVRGLILVAAVFCLLLIGIRLLQGHSWVDSILVGLTLAVAALPEEFPVVFSFFLGVGIYRLAKKKTLVRRAVSVESIGRITHICTDKTGTLTQGLLELSHVEPYGSKTISSLMRTAVFSSDPQAGDPVDLAIDTYANKIKVPLTPYKLITRFPFTEARKKESAIIQQADEKYCYLKGAPETVLSLSDLSEDEKQKVHRQILSYAETGHKVLACAKKNCADDEDNSIEPIDRFEFQGLLAFEDPARPEVKQAMASAKELGIKVIMITGDHPRTAASIAKDIGLGGDVPEIISAEDHPEKFEKDFLASNPDFLISLDVIARCTPIQKLHVVEALKLQNGLVAVTGDGINDVPALKAASVGIAMGKRGAQTAKEVSSIIVLDDNFKTIVDAIYEGKQLFRNLRSAFDYLLLIHLPLVVGSTLLPMFGYPVLFLPIHIVWLELIIHPTAILAFQTSVQKQAYLKTQTLFDRQGLFRILLTGSLVLAFMCYFFIKTLGAGDEAARTKALAVLAVWSSCVVVALSNGHGVTAIFVALTTTVVSFLLIQFGGSLGGFLHVSPFGLQAWVEVFGTVFLCGTILWLLIKRQFNMNRLDAP